jgi:DNA-directed RNA polymerase specialized sigma24 family protein
MRVFDGIGYGEIAETLNISLRKVHHMMNLYERVMVSVYGLEMDSE